MVKRSSKAFLRTTFALKINITKEVNSARDDSLSKNNKAEGLFLNGSKISSWILGKMCFRSDGGIGQCDYYYRKNVPLNVVKSRFQLIWGEAEFRILCEQVGKEDKSASWVRGEWMRLESETVKRRGLKIPRLALVCTGSGAKRSGDRKQTQKQPGEKQEQS